MLFYSIIHHWREQPLNSDPNSELRCPVNLRWNTIWKRDGPGRISVFVFPAASVRISLMKKMKVVSSTPVPVPDGSWKCSQGRSFWRRCFRHSHQNILNEFPSRFFWKSGCQKEQMWNQPKSKWYFDSSSLPNDCDQRFVKLLNAPVPLSQTRGQNPL